MKMDIEGHEFRLFPTFTPKQMFKIKQLVLEIHTPGDIQLFPDYFKGLSDITHSDFFHLMETMSETHTLIHVHPNNGCLYHRVDGVILPNVMECTYIRNDYVPERIPSTQPIPIDLDMPNVMECPVMHYSGYPFVALK